MKSEFITDDYKWIGVDLRDENDKKIMTQIIHL